MKNLKRIIYLFLITALVFTLYLFSCNETGKPDSKVTERKIDPPQFSSNGIFFDFLTSQPVLIVNYSDNQRAQYAEVSVSQAIYNEFVSYYQTQTGNTDTSGCMVFYINKLVSNITDIYSSDIKGISTFSIDQNNDMFHKLYTSAIGPENLNENTDLYCQVNSIISNHLRLTSRLLIDDLRNSVSSYIVVKNIDNPLDTANVVIDHYYSNSFRYLYNNEISLFTDNGRGGPDGPMDCESPCTGGAQNPNDVCDTWIVPPTCVPLVRPDGDCPLAVQKKDLEDDGTLSQAVINEGHDFILHYAFRDSLLVLCDWGRKIIEYYYRFDEFFKNQIQVPIALKIETCLVLIDCNEAIEKLMDPVQYGNYIFINNDLKDDITDLLSDYKLLSQDVVYNDMLDDINSDVIFFTGKTVNEVRNLIFYIP